MSLSDVTSISQVAEASEASATDNRDVTEASTVAVCLLSLEPSQPRIVEVIARIVTARARMAPTERNVSDNVWDLPKRHRDLLVSRSADRTTDTPSQQASLPGHSAESLAATTTLTRLSITSPISLHRHLVHREQQRLLVPGAADLTPRPTVGRYRSVNLTT